MKCALIGYGYWGKILKKYIDTSDFFQLAGICDPILEKGMRIEDILLDEELQCVFVCNSVSAHYLTVKKLLENRKHVFCEKPLCKSLQKTEELLDLAEKKQVCLYTDYIYTNSPSINVIKENIKILGKILYCEADMKQFGKFYKNDDVFEVLAVHMISAISYILNTHLIIKNIVSKRKNGLGLIEVASLNFETVNGVSGIINSSLMESCKERKIVFRCEHGDIIFDMLGDISISIRKYIEIENGYEEKIILAKKYDEENNLENVLKEFKIYIERKQPNKEITLNVAKTLEEIKQLL